MTGMHHFWKLKKNVVVFFLWGIGEGVGGLVWRKGSKGKGDGD